MSIIIHRNRILAKGFKEDDFEEFVKKKPPGDSAPAKLGGTTP